MPPPIALVPPAPLSLSDIRALRFSAAFPPRDSAPLPVALRRIAASLLAVQAQDPGAALLAFWLRLPPPRPSRAVLAPLILSGSSAAGLARVWANRGTLQVVTLQDRQCLAPAVLTHLRKSRDSSVRKLSIGDAGARVYDKVLEAMDEWFEQGESVSSKQLDDVIGEELRKAKDAAKGIEKRKFTKQAIDEARRVLKCSLFVLATADGRAERVLTPENRTRIVVRPTQETRMREVEEGTRECAKRYFEGYGPATEADFRYWLGVSAGQSKQAVGQLLADGELETVETDAGDMLVRKGWKRETGVEGVRLVGRFEPVLLAHKDKTWIVEEECRRKVWSKNADVVPCVLVGGRVKGVWKRDGKGICVTLFESGSNEWVGQIFERAREILRGFYEEDGEVVVQADNCGETITIEEKLDMKTARTRRSKRRRKG